MIADFVRERMTAYLNAGQAPTTAAHFVRGELEAVYMGKHYSRDADGAFSATYAPEQITLAAAMYKADAVINVIIKAHNEKENKNASGASGASVKKTGLEGLKTLWEKTV